MKLTIKEMSGKAAGELEIKFDMIENGSGTQAVQDVVVAYRAAQRMGTACTKTMGEVNGTGKKPWRQKGTGRARAGSFASPIWRGGGVVFGPKPRDFTKKVSGTTRQLALRKALSERIKAGEVMVVDDLKLSTPKTKDFVNILKALEVKTTALVVANSPDQNLRLAARNIPGVELTSSSMVNTYQVLKYDTVLFTRSAFEQVEERLTKE